MERGVQLLITIKLISSIVTASRSSSLLDHLLFLWGLYDLLSFCYNMLIHHVKSQSSKKTVKKFKKDKKRKTNMNFQVLHSHTHHLARITTNKKSFLFSHYFGIFPDLFRSLDWTNSYCRGDFSCGYSVIKISGLEYCFIA